MRMTPDILDARVKSLRESDPMKDGIGARYGALCDRPECDPENCPSLKPSSTTDDSVRDICGLTGFATNRGNPCVPSIMRQRNEAEARAEDAQKNLDNYHKLDDRCAASESELMELQGAIGLDYNKCIQRVRDLYKANAQLGWAMGQLRIAEEMARDHGLPDWLTRELLRIRSKVQCVAQMEDEREQKRGEA